MRNWLVPTLAVVLLACSASETAVQRIPADLIIQYAEGGGFTGQWTGAVITADGSVRAWSPRRSDSASTLLGTLPSATLHQLWSMVNDGDLLNKPGGGTPGNMTRMVLLSSSGKRVEIRWSYGTTPDASVQPFAALFDRCRTAVADLKP